MFVLRDRYEGAYGVQIARAHIKSEGGVIINPVWLVPSRTLGEPILPPKLSMNGRFNYVIGLEPGRDDFQPLARK